MKKYILILLSSACFSAQALTISWGTGTVAASFGGSALGTATGHLVYLGSSAAADWSISGLTPENVTVDNKGATTAPPVLAGRIVGSYAAGLGSTVGTGSDVLANGSTFGMFITYVDSNNVTWYNFSSTKFTVAGATDDRSDVGSAIFSFDFANSKEINPATESASAGGGWVAAAAVPEPATGALALAGIALLFKRRKARA